MPRWISAALPRRTLPEDASGHDALMVLGGGQSALDDEDLSLYPVAALADARFRRQRPFRARRLPRQPAAGARLRRRKTCSARRPSSAGSGVDGERGKAPSILFSAWRPTSFPIFQWHDDTFTLPSGRRASCPNPTASNQAFRVGRAAYGIQFHFEADRRLVEPLEHGVCGLSWPNIIPAGLAAMRTRLRRHGPQSPTPPGWRLPAPGSRRSRRARQTLKAALSDLKQNTRKVKQSRAWRGIVRSHSASIRQPSKSLGGTNHGVPKQHGEHFRQPARGKHS